MFMRITLKSEGGKIFFIHLLPLHLILVFILFQTTMGQRRRFGKGLEAALQATSKNFEIF